MKFSTVLVAAAAGIATATPIAEGSSSPAVVTPSQVVKNYCELSQVEGAQAFRDFATAILGGIASQFGIHPKESELGDELRKRVCGTKQ